MWNGAGAWEDPEAEKNLISSVVSDMGAGRTFAAKDRPGGNYPGAAMKGVYQEGDTWRSKQQKTCSFYFECVQT